MTDLIEDVGSITATWIDPTGVEWPLSDTSAGWFTLPGPAGWDATTYEIVTDPLPRGGEQVRSIRSQPGSITWPLYVWGETHLQFVERRRQIKRAILMTVHRGLAGTLKVERPDATARTIEAFYSAGLEGGEGQGWLFSTDAVTLWCPDGYWRSTEAVEITAQYTEGEDFLNPFPQVSPALSLGETTITNTGDVAAWPTWTITGPMTALTASNFTTGYEFTLTYPLLAGEQVVITTNRPTVRGPIGQNLASALNWPNAYLWGLLPGDNSVNFNMSGASVGSSVQLSYYPRFDGA